MRAGAGPVVAAVAACAAALAPPGAAGYGAAGAASTAARGAWTVYHGDPEGTGAVGGPSFAGATAAWTSPVLDGQLYGEPLETGGRVLVATENDTVYALAAGSGRVLWHRHLGTPVPASSLPCGDISPTVGITSTPVVDRSLDEIFVVADEEISGAPAHVLVGLDVATGRRLLRRPVDPPGASTAALLQRAGLALDRGRVLVGFGGNFGDCSTYHGWLESVPAAGRGPVARFEVDGGPGQSQGAIWMGGAAPEVDPSGSIWLAAGNGSTTTGDAPYDNSDSVLELSPSLAPEQVFAPADWYADNAYDRDLGSSAPALVGSHVVQAGKSQTAYLLDRSALGGTGGQRASVPVCPGGDVDGGDAVDAGVVYLPCRRGLEALRVGGPSPGLTVAWQATSGAVGPPIVAGGLVWSMGGATLYGLDPSTGARVAALDVGLPANHFPTPSVGDGLLLADAASQVHAFAGADGVPGPAVRRSPSEAGREGQAEVLEAHEQAPGGQGHAEHHRDPS
ncbi:MAG: PQQ-binding-like beta-propeller repeat protein [Acidimicrobiales bacterium]